MILSWLAQNSSDPTGGILLNYGPLGAVVVAAGWAIVFLYRRQEQRSDKEREYWKEMYLGEKSRADRMEATLLGLYDRVSGEFASKLVESTGAMREYAETMKNRGDR